MIHLVGPDREVITIHGHETVTLSDYYKRHCPRYLICLDDLEDDHKPKDSNEHKPKRDSKDRKFKKDSNEHKYRVVGRNKNVLPHTNVSQNQEYRVEGIKNVVFAITTYNRLSYLKNTIETWNNTKSSSFKWHLIIADDGSNDGTIEYLRNLHIENVETYILEHNRQGVHHQVNQILRLCNELNFDFGFKVDDDLVFKEHGWDELYIHAAVHTGFHHLIFYDRKWGEKRSPRPCVQHQSGLLECCTDSEEIQGALWTFTPQIIKDVGYYDLQQFGVCGYGHTDYSFRCCRAGFNDIQQPYDAVNSNQYVELVKTNYTESPNEYRYLWNSEEQVKEKKQILGENRVFVPYNCAKKRLDQKSNPSVDVSFVVPLRGREDQVDGLLYNLESMFGGINYEIIFSIQNDNRLFRRGQLCNIGFRHTKGDIIVFQDVDIRHLRYIDFIRLSYEISHPYVAFDAITQLEEQKLCEYKIIETKKRPSGYGACAVFTRQQFIKSHGFSNLIIGWGGEDNLMNQRVGFRRLYQDLGHVKHEPSNSASVKKSDWYRRNVRLWQNDNKRLRHLDSYAHTVAKEERHEDYQGIFYCYSDYITVPDTFYYRDLLMDIND